LVEVDGLPAVCDGLACDFTYIANKGEVTAFTFDESTKKLVLTGIDMPTGDDIESVVFAQSTCTVDTAVSTATSITCTLDRNPTCGTWTPTLNAKLGKIINAASALTGLAVQCTVTAANPLTALNMIGGDNITFTGTNFPYELAGNTVEVKFKDTKQTACTPQWSTTDTLVCLTTEFDESTAASQKYGVDITINGLAVTNTIEGTMMADVKSGLGLDPNSASPVLQTVLAIKIQDDFPYALNKDHFTVNATRQTDKTYMKRLNVVDINDTTKHIYVKFGGAHSDKYDVSIRHKTFGLVKTENLVLDVGSTVTSVAPKTASINGGTLLTIKGTNFGKQKTDNPVQISYNGGVGATNCYVQTTKATEITCRIDEKLSQTDGTTGTVTVFLKTSEEAKCEAAVCGGFAYTSTLPTVTAIASAFDTTTKTWEVTLQGSGFTGDTTNVEFWVGNKKQTTKSVNIDVATFTITDVSDMSIKGAKVFFDVGTPNGKDIVAGAVALTPKLVSLSPNTGSLGGTVITANVQGITKGSTIDLVKTSDGSSICASTKVVSYGVVECHTKAEEITSDMI
jgi:hypothetical protein